MLNFVERVDFPTPPNQPYNVLFTRYSLWSLYRVELSLSLICENECLNVQKHMYMVCSPRQQQKLDFKLSASLQLQCPLYMCMEMHVAFLP